MATMRKIDWLCLDIVEGGAAQDGKQAFQARERDTHISGECIARRGSTGWHLSDHFDGASAYGPAMVS